jgi:hypothetical protein
MVEKKIVAHFSTCALITAKTTRVYPEFVPEAAAFPALCYSRVSGYRVNTLSGYSGEENPLIQIDCWATAYTAAKELSTAVHSAMEVAPDFKALLISDMDLSERDLGLYRISMDFSCWNRST